MAVNVLKRESALRREADILLGERGLYDLLARYGQPQVDGSYALQLMTWRDLDIYLVVADFDLHSFFALGGDLAELLHPHKLSHRNERIAQSPGLPNGLYWGVYLGDEHKGAWKIDIWAVDQPEHKRLTQIRREIADRLTPASRERILAIKEQCWQDPRYRKEFTSMDIYRAVLDDKVNSVTEFNHWLMRYKGFSVPLSDVRMS